MNNDSLDGLKVGIQNLNVLENTDIGVLRNQKDKDNSTYTRTTKPDGTVVEKIKIRKSKKNKGLVDLKTNGVEFGENAVDVGLSKEVSEDIVGFVDSIWGSKQVAAQTGERRLIEAQQEAQEKNLTPEEKELEMFRKMREEELQKEIIENEGIGKSL